MVKKIKTPLQTIGWREWVGLPDFGINMIKVKVDTGARSSSLHAFDQHVFEKDGLKWVRFKIYPVQRKKEKTVNLESKILEFRSIRSSSGTASLRPVIITNISILGQTWPVELTLARRDEMGFRMLLGREAFRHRFLVDAGRSYYNGKPANKKTKPILKTSKKSKLK
ncbi:MAG: RimK/LysX family protein [Desulfobacterales bacterium]|nr:RimK/LysX family protein [Desulfobacterales bacterium]